MLRPTATLSLVALTAALLAPVSAATAEPPTPVDPAPEVLPAGEACAFPISLVATGKEGFVSLPNNPRFSGIAPAPGLRITVTNLDDPDNTVTVSATGAFRFIDLADGTTEILAGGHNFLYGETDIGVTAFATTGPVTLSLSVDGDFVGLDASGARVRDLCAELS